MKGFGYIGDGGENGKMWLILKMALRFFLPSLEMEPISLPVELRQVL